MKVIKIGSENFIKLLKNITGVNADIEDADIENNTCYIIETTPNINNCINYIGVTSALKVYLNLVQNKYDNFKIVLCGFENELNFYRDCKQSDILRLPNVYYHKINSENEINTDLQKLDLDLIIDSLKLIHIEAPTSYKSHHSIANEWALLRYSSMFEKDEENEDYKNLISKIKKLDFIKTLYFQYQEALISRQKINKKHLYTPKVSNVNGLTIGVVDDEIDKGYGFFYNYLLKKSGANAVETFSFIKGEDKKIMLKRFEKWFDEVKSEIDIFIIDLRLNDTDFYETKTSRLSGIQVILLIKEKNPGIQIIVSTASNKTWNLQECLKYGVDAYFVKESPELYSSREETKQSLIHLTKEIEKSAKKIFLAEMFRKIEFIKNNNCLSKETEFQDLVFKKNGFLDQLFGLLNTDSTNKSILNQCLLICYKILEKYCSLKSISDFGKDKENKISSGRIFLNDGTVKDTFINKEGTIYTLFQLKIAIFCFQKDKRTTPVKFTPFQEMQVFTCNKNGLDITFVTKMVSVLFYRDNIEENNVNEIIKWRYYRSNVSAHYTGNVDTDKLKLDANTIHFFIKIFYQIFTHKTTLVNKLQP
ncbi:response regulator [Tenacibaculum finnmarkense]|uniref:response regulator transcription factor n=1 Tax=Tenacibaculum finnmarkense TaxID=2781243 RepID=UPI001EFBEE27|nr:response regulator [Tenacibaculum finnmarkense]MCG8807434.1 response regulator [Tenacibaculum finnmarkense]MCG8817653.1 response regulator [Tenacibaculum finnmarkense]